MRPILVSLLLLAASTLHADIAGVVATPDGKPLPKATVYVHEAKPKLGVSTVCPSCYRDCGKRAQTAADGTFRLAKLDDTLKFRLLAVAEGYEPQFAEGVDPKAANVKIVLKPRAAADAGLLVTGVVRDAQSHAVPGALVEPHGLRRTFVDANGKKHMQAGYGKLPGLDQMAVTDDAGRFSLRIPEADETLDVRVSGRGFAPALAHEVAPGKPAEIVLSDGVAAYGKIVRGGKPVAGARVVFEHQNREASKFLGQTEVGTSADGTFLMTNLAPGESFDVYVPMGEIAGAAVTPHTVHTTANGTRVDVGTLVAEAGRTVSGRVVVPEGFTIPPHTNVMLSTRHGGFRTVEAAADGRFTFEHVPNDAAQVIVTVPGLKPVTGRLNRGEADVAATGDVVDLQLSFERK